VGIGFAIPAETARPIVEKLIAGEEILRGYLGVQINPVTEDYADALGIPENRGEFIQRVERGEAAERAGLQAGDVVLTVDGKAVTPDQTLSFIVANIAPGTTVPIEFLRDGQRRTVRVTVGRRPSAEELARQQFNFNEEAAPNEPALPSASGVIEQRLGVQVTALTPTIARQLGLGEGATGVVVANVDPNADAARKGLQRGTVIYSAQYQDVATPEQLEAIVRRAVAENREAILLRVQPRGGPPITVPVRLRN
jgi:serine protease Do